MNDAPRILIVNGSYRDDGITDQVVAAARDALEAAGASVDSVTLRDYPLEFCLNCRACTQQPGTEPGVCVLDDGLQALVEKIEAADAYILASPTNFGSVTAVFKRFMERLVVYAFWPWDKPWPEFRKAGVASKKALLVTSSAAPALLGRWLYASGRQLKMAAKVIGAHPVGLLYTGHAAREQQQRLSPALQQRAHDMARRLLAS